MKDFNGPEDQITVLRKLFGENRAEWPPESFNQLFVPPTYFKKLESLKPSFLVGGRGTGKTTSLQSLGYKETNERLAASGLAFSDQEYLGVLIRINKNRVHAFKGERITKDEWSRAFAHYFNLIVCLEITKMAQWLESVFDKAIEKTDVEAISIDLALEPIPDLASLARQIRLAISKLQIYVNNPSEANRPTLSIAESPLRTFVEVLGENEMLDERVVFCCVDEYENLLDYQQGVVNTYIKHASPPLSYKVGVRNYGIRNRNTTDDNDLLNNPDDYNEIQIVDEGFTYFATEVANSRLAYANLRGIGVPQAVDKFLENLPMQDEAVKLGAEKVASNVLAAVKKLDESMFQELSKKHASDIYFIEYWREKSKDNLLEVVKESFEKPQLWKQRVGNHGYASLFWLSKGQKGRRIKKYYSGVNAFLSLAGGNIRYFLQLLDASIFYELGENEGVLPESFVLSPRSQTLALRYVGKKRLDQIEGLAEKGVQLKRLMLAIGRVFFEMARNPTDRAPEVNSFVLSGDPESIDRIGTLLKDGVGHLAFEVNPRTKNTSNLELRDDEFRLHRIYSGYFEISYRKKRRTTFNANDLIEAVEGSPSRAISALLNDQDLTETEELSEQLAFFSSFYDGEGSN